MTVSFRVKLEVAYLDRTREVGLLPLFVLYLLAKLSLFAEKVA